MNLGGWYTTEPDENGEMHTVPVDDIRQHMTVDCPCCPVRDADHYELWVHYAFDKRDLYETGQLKLN